MDRIPPGSGAWTYLIPILIIGLVIVRNLRARTLKIERLWISPALVILLTVLVFSQASPPGFVGLCIDVIALAVSALLGWWRARTSRFTIDAQAHVITSKVSPVGLMLILGIVALRYLVRGLATAEASVLHVTVAEVTDSFLLMAVGLVSAQRVEWFVRARKMIAGAKSSGAAA